MAGRSKPWYQSFQIVAWVVGGLGALGTVIVVISRYIELPQKVEAAQQKNVEQDKALDKLTAIQETWQNIYQQQQQAPNQPAMTRKEWWNPTLKEWLCCDPREGNCDTDDIWYRCPNP